MCIYFNSIFFACFLGLKLEFKNLRIFGVNFHKNADSEKTQSSIFTKNYRKILRSFIKLTLKF